jgi:hypothetical protein
MTTVRMMMFLSMQLWPALVELVELQNMPMLRHQRHQVLS